MAAIRGGPRGPGRCARWRRTGRDETAPRPYTPCQWFTTIVTARLSDISWRSSRSVGAPRRYAHPLGGIGRSAPLHRSPSGRGHETRPRRRYGVSRVGMVNAPGGGGLVLRHAPETEGAEYDLCRFTMLQPAKIRTTARTCSPASFPFADMVG